PSISTPLRSLPEMTLKGPAGRLLGAGFHMMPEAGPIVVRGASLTRMPLPRLWRSNREFVPVISTPMDELITLLATAGPPACELSVLIWTPSPSFPEMRFEKGLPAPETVLPTVLLLAFRISTPTTLGMRSWPAASLPMNEFWTTLRAALFS